MSIKGIRIILFFSAFSFFLVSCQKEVSVERGGNGTGSGSGSGGGSGSGSGGSGSGGGNTQNIIGDYDFINMSAHTVSTVTVSILGDQMKTVTTSDYLTKNNSGTVKITT